MDWNGETGMYSLVGGTEQVPVRRGAAEDGRDRGAGGERRAGMVVGGAKRKKRREMVAVGAEKDTGTQDRARDERAASRNV